MFSCPIFLCKQHRHLEFILHMEGKQETIKGDTACAQKCTAADYGSIAQSHEWTREEISNSATLLPQILII